MLAEILRGGFARAHRRIDLVFLDILWKTVWLFCSIAVVILVVAWFGAELRGLAWEDTGTRTMNVLVAAEALREFWSVMKDRLLLSALVVTGVCAASWFVLEALVRSSFLKEKNGEIRERPHFSVFLVARITKAGVLTAAGLVLLFVWREGAPAIAAFIFLSLAFCLSLVETLIRADAVELLGADLIRVTLLIGILLSFEMMVAAAFGVILAAGFLNVARLSEALAMLGATGSSVLLLSVLHSYLLLVRFSAVGIMRENVVAV